MLSEGTFIDDEHEYRLRELAERVATVLRSAGFPIMREESPWEAGGATVRVNTFIDAPGVYVGWYPSVALNREIREYLTSGPSDHPKLLRYHQVREAMEEALAKVVQAFGLVTHYHKYEDWAGLEVRDPAQERETP